MRLPSLPEMVFPHNLLELEHGEFGVKLQFSALEALKMVDCNSEPLKVAMANHWESTR